ncbi:MAG: leucine-rich repeat domain-containing protein [Microcoleus sp. SM1_3_4]|nr:leucine-rich repeat domain-containing protein [Microcoleus sp. SM1_3_4]
MNLRKLIVVTCSAIFIVLSGSELAVLATEARSGNNQRTFADWCRQKDSLSPETKHTVEVLLEEAKTNDCDAADRKLSSLTKLYFYDQQISDIKPLASLTNLTHIELSNNQIGDIKPLASLTNLTNLSLSFNRIGDIKPLASLTNLTWLEIEGNHTNESGSLNSLSFLFNFYFILKFHNLATPAHRNY